MKDAFVIVIYNIDHLLQRQLDLIRKYCKGEYDIIVINNSDIEAKANSINVICNANGLIYLKTDSGGANPSDSHAFAISVAHNTYRDSYRRICYLDHDIFPVKEFSFDGLLNDTYVAGNHQQRPYADGVIEYMWPGLLAINYNMVDKDLINCYPTVVNGVMLDTGGRLYNLLNTLPRDKYRFLDEIYERNPAMEKSQYSYYSMMADKTFMHFIGASNWMGKKDTEQRVQTLLKILDEKTA